VTITHVNAAGNAAPSTFMAAFEALRLAASAVDCTVEVVLK